MGSRSAGIDPRPLVAVMGLRGFPGVQGGVEKHCEALYPRIDGYRFRVYRRRSYVADETSPWCHISFKDLPSTRIGGFEATFQTFLASLHAIVKRPALVHVHNIGPGLFIPFMRLFGLKTVLTYHSSNYEHSKWSKAAKAVLRMAERLSVRYADRVIFVNRRQYERLSLQYPDKCVYMPNGVEPASASESTSVLDELRLTPGDYILGVGRLTPEKGFEYLVEAVNKIDSELRIVIAGGCDHDTEYFNKLKNLDVRGRVTFAGNRRSDELAQLYPNARLFVLSSVNEGFPLVLLEAMSHSLPVIASDIPATDIPQLTSEHKFKPADSESLAQCLERTLADGASTVGYDLSEYDWQELAQRVAAQYKAVIEH